ncbi:MAG: hypothetical protein WAO74_06400 [Polaribacter sp.]|uniref:hypothetical protein n=1 Tax=Polaribacter sp. TaxID=1920175 RepID=UPI003BB14642
MKNKLFIIFLFFFIYFSTYFFFGKSSLGLQVIQNKTFVKNQDSIQIQLFNLEDYNRNQLKVRAILEEKGFKEIKVNYADNFINNNNNNNMVYWLDLKPLTPFITFIYDGNFKAKEISEEFESLYIWFFFKWIKIYKSENRAMH